MRFTKTPPRFLRCPSLRALDMIEQWPGADSTDIRIYAHGYHGIYGRLASVLDSRIRSVVVVNGMKSYAEWVGARHYDAHDIKSLIVRGMLRYFDLPEIEAKSSRSLA